MRVDGNQGGAPNYFPNSFGGPEPSPTGKRFFPILSKTGDQSLALNGDILVVFIYSIDSLNDVLLIISSLTFFPHILLLCYCDVTVSYSGMAR